MHGDQPWFEWVPFIHPPGYSVFMNAVDGLAENGAWSGAQIILVQGALWRMATVALLAWGLRRPYGAPAAVFAAALVALSPQQLRPFEHYPLATFLGAVALVALLRWVREGEAARWPAVVAVFFAVELHLSNWFVVGGFVAAVFFFVGRLRKEAVLASAAMIGAFLLTTYPGLYHTLTLGAEDDVGDMARGVMTVDWANHWLLAAAAIWVLPPLARRRPEGLALAAAVALFSGITLGLQHLQLADGQPYPYGLHYFELVDVPVAIAAALALREGFRLVRPRWGRAMLGAVGGALLASQLGLFAEGQRWVWINPVWFWTMAWPFGSGL